MMKWLFHKAYSIKRLLKSFPVNPFQSLENFWQVWSLSFPRLNHLILLLPRSHLFIKLLGAKAAGVQKLWTQPTERFHSHEMKVKHQKSHSGQMCLSCLYKAPLFGDGVWAQKSRERAHTREQEELFALIKLTTHGGGLFAWCSFCVSGDGGVFSLGVFPAPICTRTLASSGNVSNNLTVCHAWAPKGENEKCVRTLWRRRKRSLGGELPMPLFPTCVHYLMSPTRFPSPHLLVRLRVCNVMQYSTAPIKLELERLGNWKCNLTPPPRIEFA